jgi:uncharacterized glyoxalase superfamily protein PhnB
MSEVELTEQLNQAIDAMIATGELPASVEKQVAELLGVAVKLRQLPRAEFREHLRTELEKEGRMNTATKPTKQNINPVREGFRTITPYLVVPDVHAEAEFLQQAFGVTGQIHGLGTQGGFHAEYNIGGSMIMVGGGGQGSQWKGTPLPGAIHLYVEEVDNVYQSAVQAGATSLMSPTDMPYGERGAAIEDVGGNHWYLATAFGDDYVPSGVPNLIPFFNPRGAPKMIDFLKQAFAAEELSVHKSPEGRVLHAEMKIGTSVVEMGEAHEQWQPRAAVFMMYVDDVDAWFARASEAAGVTVKEAPRLQPHGARVGSIKDPFDNTWYIASQQQPIGEKSQQPERTSMGAPKLFRIALQIGDLDQAREFYSKLLDDPGIPIPRGSRHYFHCGPMILALVDVAKGAGETPQPTPDYIYFAVNNLEEIFERAKAMDCLCQDRYHDQQAGEIVMRPWGERSFYVEDPWGNGLCFVDETTLFTGR